MYKGVDFSNHDVAAGVLIVQQAGALVTDLAGGNDFTSPSQFILAANPIIHKLMLRDLERK